MKRFLPILLVLVLSFALVVPCFAASNAGLPDPYSVWTDTEKYPYAFVYHSSVNDTYRLYLCATRPYYSSADDKVHIDFNAYGDAVSIYQFDSNTASWVFSKNYSTSHSVSSDLVLISSVDILDGESVWMSADTDFFTPPRPLHQIVGEVAGEHLTEKALPKLGTEIMTIVACSVGCLALLIGLSLFGKRSLLYRS